MRPLSSAVCRRFLLLGALILALAFAGCGGSDPASPGEQGTGGDVGTAAIGGSAATGNDTAGPGAEPGGATGSGGGETDSGGRRVVASGPCRSQLGTFVHSLDRLRVRLATGLSYGEYAAAVKKTRGAYAALPAAELPADCLVAAATAAEQSLNHYIEAANAWGECLADAGCDAGIVEPELQRDWQVASHWLSEAQEGLKQLP
jgi:hypothetical protein